MLILKTPSVLCDCMSAYIWRRFQDGRCTGSRDQSKDIDVIRAASLLHSISSNVSYTPNRPAKKVKRFSCWTRSSKQSLKVVMFPICAEMLNTVFINSIRRYIFYMQLLYSVYYFAPWKTRFDDPWTLANDPQIGYHRRISSLHGNEFLSLFTTTKVICRW